MMSHLYGEEMSEGAMVGPFLVDRVHFRGVMSVLHLARDTRTGRRAALKVLRFRYALSDNAFRRFRQEAAILGALRHPHIVELLDCGELTDGRPYLALEWLDGQDLDAELSARGHLGTREALVILEQLVGALAVAHHAGVVHRDLKAQNVMVLGKREKLRIKLVDFGIAKPLAPGAAMVVSSTGRLLGTPIAMAPEQIRGGNVDARTDVYALGILTYQLLTGRLPFQAATAQELEELHLHAPAPRVSLLTAMPPAVDAVLLRCLEKRPNDRYPSVEDVLADLRLALGEERATAVVPSRAAAVYLQVTAPAIADDALLDQADTVLEQARRALSVERLPVRAEGSSFLLAAAFLPPGVDAEREARARVVTFGLKLLAALEAARGGGPLSVAMVLHVAPADARSDPRRADSLPTGEELLNPVRWSSGLPARGLAATSAMLEGLGGAYDVSATSPTGELWHIKGPVGGA